MTTVHGATCLEAGTVGTSEPHSLGSIPDGKAILATWSHKAGKRPAGPGNIPWPAGRIIKGGNLQQKLRINKQQSICCVLPSLEMHHLHTCECFKANVKICKKINYAACQWSMTLEMTTTSQIKTKLKIPKWMGSHTLSESRKQEAKTS